MNHEPLYENSPNQGFFYRAHKAVHSSCTGLNLKSIHIGSLSMLFLFQCSYCKAAGHQPMAGGGSCSISFFCSPTRPGPLLAQPTADISSQSIAALDLVTRNSVKYKTSPLLNYAGKLTRANLFQKSEDIEYSVSSK